MQSEKIAVDIRKLTKELLDETETAARYHTGSKHAPAVVR